MTLQQFIKLSGKKEKTVLSWFKRGIVPGVKQENKEWTISDLAMPPYTEGRPKRENASSVRKTILKAAIQHKSTSAEVFNLPPKVFNAYITDLAEKGLIRVIEDERFPGEKFVITTIATEDYMQSHGVLGKDGIIVGLTAKAIEAAVTGLIKATMEKAA